MRKHALLSPSAAHRWLNCPPSARLCEDIADQTSSYAEEGSQAHELCEYKLRKFLGDKAKDPCGNLSYYDQTMEDATDDYLSFCTAEFERLKSNGEPFIAVEQRVRYEEYVPEGFGTGDCVVIADGTLHIVDYKHGQGVLVEAEDNPQMKLYALGALELFDGIYDIDRVSMTIYQPRRDNISTHTVFKESLYQWADEVLKPTAEIAYAGGGEYNCGEWCQFCKAKHECRKRAEANMALAGYDFKRPPLLEDDEIEAILGKVDGLVAWANDIKDYALQAALSGKRWDGWKLVEGRSNRRYIDEKAVAETVEGAGYDPYEHKVMGITAMEKTLGKGRFSELLGALVEKPQGKPTLVPEGDKRPASGSPRRLRGH
jgi:hypothetical protein